MTDNNDMEVTAPGGAALASAETPAPSKHKTARRAKSSPISVRTASKGAGGKIHRHSEQERSEKIARIEAAVAAGTGTLKQAIIEADISEQTYYQWKRTTQSNEKSAEKPVAKLASVADALEDLVQLEAENQRLRKLLADKLREENAELRKRLGLD